MPESPRFLVAAGKTEQAAEVLEKVACDNKKDLLPGRLKGASCDVSKVNLGYESETLLLYKARSNSTRSFSGSILFDIMGV